MNIIAVDIGNTNIRVGLWLDSEEKWVERMEGGERAAVEAALVKGWDSVPASSMSSEGKKDAVIVASSTRGEWLAMVEDICGEVLGEKVKVVGRDFPLPIEVGVEKPENVGTDRVVNAAAAFAVIEDAVVVADFGSAVTIDMVDSEGVFLGGIIAPGLAMGSRALNEFTAKLPLVDAARPVSVIGGDTDEAIRSGLYYGAVGMLETVTRLYAEQIGKWPQLILTGGGAKVIRGDCVFADSWIDELTVRATALAYIKSVADRSEVERLVEKLRRGKGQINN
jgi:type III pantothenate kinase